MILLVDFFMSIGVIGETWVGDWINDDKILHDIGLRHIDSVGGVHFLVKVYF